MTSKDTGYCYVWIKSEAGRGVQEVGSCLLLYINNELTVGTEDLTIWSDSGGG